MKESAFDLDGFKRDFKVFTEDIKNKSLTLRRVIELTATSVRFMTALQSWIEDMPKTKKEAEISSCLRPVYYFWNDVQKEHIFQHVEDWGHDIPTCIESLDFLEDEVFSRHLKVTVAMFPDMASSKTRVRAKVAESMQDEYFDWSERQETERYLIRENLERLEPPKPVLRPDHDALWEQWETLIKPENFEALEAKILKYLRTVVEKQSSEQGTR